VASIDLVRRLRLDFSVVAAASIKHPAGGSRVDDKGA
jgi:hypothetical protein